MELAADLLAGNRRRPSLGAEAHRGYWRSMSENLEFVRAIYAAWERGDFTSADWADPTIEFEIVDGPDPTKAVGLADMARTWKAVGLSMWDGFRVGAQEYRELDDERILVCVHNSGRG